MFLSLLTPIIMQIIYVMKQVKGQEKKIRVWQSREMKSS